MPGTFKDSTEESNQPGAKESWRPIGKESRKPFDLYSWFTGSSAPGNWGKGDPLRSDLLGGREGLLALQNGVSYADHITGVRSRC